MGNGDGKKWWEVEKISFHLDARFDRDAVNSPETSISMTTKSRILIVVYD